MLLNQELKKSQVFSQLAEDQLEMILSMMSERTVRANDSIFRQGDLGNSLVVIISGELLVQFTQNRGRNVEIDRLTAGGVLGELSFLDPAPRSATVIAVKESTLREMDHDLFRSLVKQHSEIASLIMTGLLQIVLDRSTSLQARIWEAIGGTPSEPASPNVRRGRRKGSLDPDALKDPHLKTPYGFSIEDLIHLANFCPCRSYPLGTSFYEEGERANSCILLIKGKVRVFQLAQESEQLLATIEGGNIIGQTALVSETNRSATVHAITPVTIIEITRDDYAQIVSTKSHLALVLQERLLIDGIQQHRNIVQRLNSVSRLNSSSPKRPLSPKTTKRPITDDTEIITEGLEQFRQPSSNEDLKKTDPVLPIQTRDDTRETDPSFEIVNLPTSSDKEKIAEAYTAGINEWSVNLDDYDDMQLFNSE